VNGDEYFDYLHETNGIYLANSLTSDFNSPNEKSFQVAYAINMAEYGVPGLKFNVYSARGWGIDGTHYNSTAYGEAGKSRSDLSLMDGEKHQEYGVRRGLRRAERATQGYRESCDLRRTPWQRSTG